MTTTIEPPPRVLVDSDAKIHTLFTQRRIWDQIDDLRIEECETVLDHLASLQRSIYDLDAYFERSWDIDSDRLEFYWTTIRERLSCIPGQGVKDEFVLQDILEYQQLEQGLRHAGGRQGLSLCHCYRLKTCDVRLSRRLLFGMSDLTPAAQRHLRRAWDILDQVSEIGDDFADIEEDRDSLNGNWLLITANARGVPATYAAYLDLLTTLWQEARRLREHTPDRHPGAHPLDLAAQRAKALANLLEARTSDPRCKGLPVMYIAHDVGPR